MSSRNLSDPSCTSKKRELSRRSFRAGTWTRSPSAKIDHWGGTPSTTNSSRDPKCSRVRLRTKPSPWMQCSPDLDRVHRSLGRARAPGEATAPDHVQQGEFLGPPCGGCSSTRWSTACGRTGVQDRSLKGSGVADGGGCTFRVTKWCWWESIVS